MQMQLSFDVRIPDGLLAANALLNEKPHQGVPSWNLALHQGIDERNSTAAIGIRASAQLNRIWPRYTGKERDTESGLDYFGARYYRSDTGRWMSPDWSEQPQPIPFVDMDNPQSLNLYGYAENSPLSNRDFDGHTINCEPDFWDAKTNTLTAGACLSWWDFPGFAFVGLTNLMLKGHEAQGLKQMAYGYGGEIAMGAVTGFAVGTVIQGVGTVIRSVGGKIVVERVMTMAELEATESTGLLKGGRGGTLGNPNYVTDTAPDTVVGAKADLALPGTPTVKVTMELDTSGTGAALGKSGPVKADFGQPGGGTERLAIGQMPAKILSVQVLK